MAESDMRAKVLKALRPLDAVPVENRVGPGTPDVEFIGGWVELKWLRALPKNPSTKVAIDHFTPQQRLWLRRRARRGGRVWLLLQCRKTWLLFWGPDAADAIGTCTWDELRGRATAAWVSGLNKKELIECLQNKI
jgi:hypothetical protein